MLKEREPRQAVLIAARVRLGGAWSSATIRNVSARGLMLSIASPPPRGSYLEICVGAHTIIARTVWARRQCCGLRAQSAIDIAAISGPRPVGRQHPRTDPEPAAPPLQPRRTRPDERAARSRRQAALLQFMLVVGVGASAASGLAWEAYRSLASPMESINSRL